jgi:hypothetical protein
MVTLRTARQAIEKARGTVGTTTRMSVAAVLMAALALICSFLALVAGKRPGHP